MIKQLLALAGLALSLSANAATINTVERVGLQWAESSYTQGQSRDDVEARLLDVNDDLYGFRYASRGEVQDLLFSYASWDGKNGFHGDATVVTGIANLISEFGATKVRQGDGIDYYYTTVDGKTVAVQSTSAIALYGLYGDVGACGPKPLTCHSNILTVSNADGMTTMVFQGRDGGWDSSYHSPHATASQNRIEMFASFIVRPVPLPAAGWLFISALVGLFGKKYLQKKQTFARQA
jgi:hypothetical protein